MLISMYQYPLTGTSYLHAFVYKLIILLQDTKIMKYIQRKIIAKHIATAFDIEAYRSLYQNILSRELSSLPIVSKQTLHINFPNIKNRLPDHFTEQNISEFQIMATSGSTTGHPSEIPIAQTDIMYLQNYYQLLAKISGGIMPSTYKYINMFPISGSSTGIFSELVVPERFRLGRSNTSPQLTVQLIRDSGVLLTNSKLGIGNEVTSVPLALGGLPILHLDFLAYLKHNNISDVLDYIKLHGICVYGGESPTINERLQLSTYYSQLMSIYGSTEQSPRLGFSLEPNLIFDIALTIDSIRKELIKDNLPPITFFYDKYLHNYEVINDTLIDTPLVQQAELKIKWDQEDVCDIMDPSSIMNVINTHKTELLAKIKEIDHQYQTNLEQIVVNLFAGKYKKLTKYYGLILMYGRKGIIYGGANLDNKFVEIVFEKFCNKYPNVISHLALHRSPAEDINKENITTKSYSGLKLNILVDIVNQLDDHHLIDLKNNILQLMQETHHDFEQILLYYKSEGLYDQVINNIKMLVYHNETSPMHTRFINSKKRIFIFKKIDETPHQLI